VKYSYITDDETSTAVNSTQHAQFSTILNNTSHNRFVQLWLVYRALHDRCIIIALCAMVACVSQMQVGWVKIGHFRRKTRYNSKMDQLNPVRISPWFL